MRVFIILLLGVLVGALRTRPPGSILSDTPKVEVSARCKHSGICQHTPTPQSCSVNKPAPYTGSDSTKLAQARDELLACTFNAEDRAERVKDATRWTWKGYRDCAWGWDELAPLSCRGERWFGLSLTAVDGLDTLYLMGLKEEFQEALDLVLTSTTPGEARDVNMFETTIRIVGGMLSIYNLTQQAHPETAQQILDLAVEVGSRLMPGFNSPTGIPYTDVYLNSGTARNPGHAPYSSTSEAGTLSLEFTTLARYTGHSDFETNAMRVHDAMTEEVENHDGLLPQMFDNDSGRAVGGYIMMGARSDSYYEYLLKQWILTGKTDTRMHDRFVQSMKSVREQLLKWTRTDSKGLLYVAELQDKTVSPKMDHLVCFLPGLLALADYHGVDTRRSSEDLTDLQLAKELTRSCYEMYRRSPAGLAPEIVHFDRVDDEDQQEEEELLSEEVGGKDFHIKGNDGHNLLRPETVESIYLMWKVTGDPMYRDWAWMIFRAFERWTRLEGMDQCKAADPVAVLAESVWTNCQSAAAVAVNAIMSGHSAIDALNNVGRHLNTTTAMATEEMNEYYRHHGETNNIAIAAITKVSAAAAAAATIDALEGHLVHENAGAAHPTVVTDRQFYGGCTSASKGGGYTNLDSVLQVPPPRRDKMESFWLAETLKYMYLIFAEPPDRCLHPSCIDYATRYPSEKALLPLDSYVFNTEAHPLAIAGPAHASLLSKSVFNQELLKYAIVAEPPVVEEEEEEATGGEQQQQEEEVEDGVVVNKDGIVVEDGGADVEYDEESDRDEVEVSSGDPSDDGEFRPDINFNGDYDAEPLAAGDYEPPQPPPRAPEEPNAAKTDDYAEL